MNKVEHVILNHLFLRDEYLRKVIPFLSSDYFIDPAERTIFRHIADYVEKYNVPPTPEAIDISLQNDKTIGEREYKSIIETLQQFQDTSDADQNWLIDTTETFCKDKAMFNALSRAVRIMDGQDEQFTKNAIPSILQDALAVSFDTNIGHDYTENASDRHDYYTRKEEKIPFDIDLLNKITRGGIPKKTLNLVMAPTGVGKSIFLCHNAANYLTQGKNVLYITLEMSEERIAERIDANLMDIVLEEIPNTEKEHFLNKIAKIRKKTEGKLIIKEYPTGAAHVGHFRALLSELRIKKNFIPDVIIVDYLNLCASSRIKMSSNANTYVIVKAVAEELRGLFVEQNVMGWSATQTNRNGFDNSDIDITDTSESMGVTHTADFFVALIQDEEMEENNRCLIKQLKNRFGKKVAFRKFNVGLDKDKMRFFDLEWSANRDLVTQNLQEAAEEQQIQTRFTDDKFTDIQF